MRMRIWMYLHPLEDNDSKKDIYKQGVSSKMENDELYTWSNIISVRKLLSEMFWNLQNLGYHALCKSRFPFTIVYKYKKEFVLWT